MAVNVVDWQEKSNQLDLLGNMFVIRYLLLETSTQKVKVFALPKGPTLLAAPESALAKAGVVA